MSYIPVGIKEIKKKKKNILLDFGCQNTVISESCVNRLGLLRSPSKIFINGFGSTGSWKVEAGTTRGMVNLIMRSLHNSERIEINAHIFKKLTSNLPPIELNTHN